MTCPDHLSELARLEWNRIAAQHPTADSTTIAAYCAAYGRWVEAEQKINEFGVVIKAKSGNAQTNPYVAVAEQSLNTMHKFLALLNHTDSRTVF
jgi:P27 family predicted phage terminase small subunit